jgi:hypothetical protein
MLPPSAVPGEPASGRLPGQCGRRGDPQTRAVLMSQATA